jgi:beta-phosphoglucomutase-like phosphatase (HAD superfamily)
MKPLIHHAEPPACVLFDLDGTLLDTAPDLAAALNRLRRERGEPELPFALIRPTVSHGSPGMLKASFGVVAEDSGYAELNQRFLALYQEFIAVETALFPGMAEAAAALTSTRRRSDRYSATARLSTSERVSYAAATSLNRATRAPSSPATSGWRDNSAGRRRCRAPRPRSRSPR